jgi:thiol:disulfide interchange protein
MIRRILTALLLLSLGHNSYAQNTVPQLFNDQTQFGSSVADDVQPELTAVLIPLTATTAELRVTLSVPEEFYVYSMDRSFGGHTEIRLQSDSGLTPTATQWTPDREPKAEDDPYLEQRVEKFIGGATWTLPLQSSAPLTAATTIRGDIKGQYCGTGEFGICKPINPPMPFTATVVGEIPASGSPAVSESATRVTIIPELRHDEPDPAPPIQFDIALEPQNVAVGGEVTLSITATLGDAWHTYALDQDEESGGGIPTEILLYESSGLEPIGEAFQSTTPPTVKEDFGIVQRTHYGKVTWTRQYVVTSENVAIEGGIVFQLCTEHNCLAATETEFQLGLTASAGQQPAIADSAVPPVTIQPSDGETGTDGEFASSDPRARGLLFFVLSAFGAGALALLTPCVFPMIPVTVAFFLKQSEKKHGNALVLAAVYSGSIVLAFTVLGVMVAAIFGPQELTDAANNPWLNLFFAALFMAFGLSLMGMFELRVPSFLLTWSSSKESVGGLAGVVFMALTFTLVSFTCTFAFLGPILVWAAQGELFWPILGMLSFSSAFAAPFFLLAMFPSMLKKLPKSGGWLNSVKVTMGFVEFALVLKFLSVADIALSSTGMPYWIDAQGFLVCWMVLFAITGMYLLGLFRMDHDMPVNGVSPIRCMVACGFLCFSGYVAVGMFAAEEPRGWLWEQVVAFAPPEFEVDQNSDSELVVMHDDLSYHLDLAAAIQESQDSGRPLFIDFTGVNCVNCRKMEKTVLNKDVVLDVLQDCVRAQLFVDLVPIPDKRLAEELLEANQKLQRDWFGDVTMPAYAIVSSDGTQVLARYKNLDTSGGVDFRRFLDAGLERWELETATDKISTVSQTAELPPSGGSAGKSSIGLD